MTADEIALMREIVRWRKNHDVDFWRARRIGRFIEWKHRASNRSVAHDLNDPEVSYGPANGTHDRIEVTSVTQAVDVLVALGYLPARFSSAYAEGWYARWGEPDDNGWTDEQYAAVAPAGRA